MLKCYPGTLVDVIADVEGIDRATVQDRFRRAQVAGFIHMAGRGRGSASMAFSDAANALIAVNGPAKATHVADFVGKCRGLVCTSAFETFGDALEDLLRDPPDYRAHVTFEKSGLYARIEEHGSVLEFGAHPDPARGDRQEFTSITDRTLRAVHEAITMGAPVRFPEPAGQPDAHIAQPAEEDAR